MGEAGVHAGAARGRGKSPHKMFLFPPSPSCPPALGHQTSRGWSRGSCGRSGRAPQPPRCWALPQTHTQPPHPPPGTRQLCPRKPPMEREQPDPWVSVQASAQLCASVSLPTAALTAASLGQGPVQRLCRTGREGSPVTGHPQPMWDPWPLRQLSQPGSGTGWAPKGHQSPFSTQLSQAPPPFSPRSAPALQNQRSVQADPLKKELAERCCPPRGGRGQGQTSPKQDDGDRQLPASSAAR